MSVDTLKSNNMNHIISDYLMNTVMINQFGNTINNMIRSKKH